VLKIYEHQCEIGIENFARLHKAVENRITAIFMSGTDFGAQRGSFISNKTYREMYLPFQKRMNDWVHKNTTWKCFLHSCGSIVALMPDLIEAGFDIFNPVQTSAAGMDPSVLKERFGEQVTFWGGGVDTQRTLPFGTPEQIRAEVKERIRIFGSGGGFVFNPSHNIQAGIPVKNLLALFQAVKDFGSY
jgi:uroporphyrinogen-III decarboxylase